MLATNELSITGEPRDVLEAYRMFAHDRGWLRRLREAVDSGLTAEAAVERVQNETRARLLRQTDPYMRERLHDLDDLSNRLLRQLTGKRTASSEVLPEDSIICARGMGPAELLDYDRKRVRGLVLEEGSATAHVSIVARALGIPMVGGIEGLIERINAGDSIIADGDSGEVYVRPQPDVIQAYAEKARFRARRQAQYAAVRHAPAITVDGERVTLNLNAGLLVDLPHLDQSGAEGIGLFRTELQFMISATMPALEAQRDLYRRVLDAAGDRPVVFRTLDLGGDKMLPYFRIEREENPALGWRSLRIGLDRPALLRYQIRALIAAAEGRALNIMFPMVAEVAEFMHAKGLIERERQRRVRLGLGLPSAIRVGLHARGALARLRARGPVRRGRFHFGRLERFAAIFLRQRPHQSAGGGALRPFEPGALKVSAWDRRHLPRAGSAGGPVRRDGRPAARCHGLDRPRLSLDFHAAGGARAGQDDGAEPRRQGLGAGASAVAQGARAHAKAPSRALRGDPWHRNMSGNTGDS